MVCTKPELASDERFSQNSQRVANRRQLDEEITAVFLGLSKADLVERLMNASIAFSSLNSVEEFSIHPQLQLMTVETAAGTVEIIAPWGCAQPGGYRRVPGLGEHSESIRAEFGQELPNV